MEIIKAILFFLFLCNGFAHAEDWTTTQKALYGTYIGLNVIDASQTIHASRDGYTELNPIYGSHPSTERVLLTKVFLVGAVGVLADHVPSTPRTLVLGFLNVLQVGVIEHNRSIGLKIGIGF